MQVLFVSHFLPPVRNAGTENYTLALARALAKRGHAVTAACAEGWDEGPAHWNGATLGDLDGIPVHRLHLNWARADNPNRALYDNPAVERWFDELFSQYKPDIVHVTSLLTLGLGVLRSAHRAEIPLVVTLMDFWFLCPGIQLLRSDMSLCDGRTDPWDCQACLTNRSRPFQLITRILPGPAAPRFWDMASRVPFVTRRRGFRGMLLDVAERKRLVPGHLRLADRVLAHSEAVVRMFARNGFDNVRLLRHGNDLEWRRGYQRTPAGEQVRFGYIGQLDHIKGVHLLIEAFRALNSRSRRSLDIWGDLTRSPEHVSRLRALARDDETISFRGRYERASLGNVLGEIDVLVVPSLWYENSPLVIQEAYAAGIPVIATDLGGMREAVTQGASGLLFERGNARDLAAQMQRVLDEPLLLSALREGIPEVRTSDEEVAEIEALYQELTPARKQSRGNDEDLVAVSFVRGRSSLSSLQGRSENGGR